MTVTYSSAGLVAAYLQRPAFSASTTPTTATVNLYINWAESEIERRTFYAYQAVTATDEVHTTQTYGSRKGYRSYYLNRPYVQLAHSPIRTMTAGLDYLYVFTGGAWVDWVATKTEGRDEDYWVDTQNGRIYFMKGYPLLSYPDNVKVTYRWGESTVAPWAQELATMMAAVRVLEMDADRTVSSEGGSGDEVDFPRIDTTIASIKADIERKLMFKQKKRAIIN